MGQAAGPCPSPACCTTQENSQAAHSINSRPRGRAISTTYVPQAPGQEDDIIYQGPSGFITHCHMQHSFRTCRHTPLPGWWTHTHTHTGAPRLPADDDKLCSGCH